MDFATIVGATLYGALMGNVFSGGSKTRVVYKTDPNLVNQIDSLKDQLSQQGKAHQDLINSLNQRIRDVKRENCKSKAEIAKAHKEAMKLKELLDAANAKERARLEELEKLRNYPPQQFQCTEFWKKPNSIHIGIVGSSGTGKSTFINTIRGLSKRDEGAAAVSHGRECTESESPYEFITGNNLRVVFWDLPGGGTEKNPWKTYLCKFGLRYFNFVIQMNVTRFTEGDAMLLQEMREHKIPNALIRNKIDAAVQSAEWEGDDVPTVLQEIRNDFVSRGVENVFLISSHLRMLYKYDMPKLKEHMARFCKVELFNDKT